MFAKRSLRLAFCAVVGAATVCAQSAADEGFAQRVLRMSDAEQVAAVRAYLDAGAPVGQEQGIFGLAMAHSELILPVLERKVEEVLRAQDPMDCFTNKNTRPDSVIALVVSMITHSDGDPAMKELAKLVALDEKRFGREVFSGLAAHPRTKTALLLRTRVLIQPIPR